MQPPPNEYPRILSLVPQTRLILDSYERLLGRPLLPNAAGQAAPTPDPAELARKLFDTPFVVASTDNADDPILNYGNRAALDLWKVDWKTFTRMPGRQTAEVPERAERERFLDEVRRKGFISNYSGIRVASDGRRFRIANATVWNLTQPDGSFAGQAVRFDAWSWL